MDKSVDPDSMPLLLKLCALMNMIPNLFRLLLLAFFCVAPLTVLYAQEIISGEIIDAKTGEPLPGVHVVAAGNTGGTISDISGSFQLSAPRGTPVNFTFVGYEPQTILPEKAHLQIALRPSLTTLNPLIISASREAQQRKDIPMAIGKVGSKTLEETKAASLEHVINKVSGVFMVNLGNEQHSMSIRQPISHKSLFLYLEDGIPVRPTGVFNHNALIELNMAAVNSIEVVKGPASSIYGSEAIGGSVNFITKRPSAYPSANISLQRDNLGYKRVDFGASNSYGKFGLYAGGYYANRSDGYRAHSDFDKLALTVRGDYKLGDRDKITTTASFISYEADMTGSIDSAEFYSKQYPSLHTFTNRTVKAFRARSTLEHFWSDKSKIAFTLLFRNNSIGQNPAYRVKNNPVDPLKASGEINTNSFQSYGLVLQQLQEFNFWDARLIGGLSLDYSPNTFFAEYIAVQRDESGIYSSFNLMDSVLTHYEVGLLNAAAYTQLDLNPVKNLRVVVALRYDRFLYNYNNFLASDAFSGAPDSKDGFNNLSPKIGLTYDFHKDRGIYANYSIGFVPPQVSELYRGVKVPVLEPSIYRNYEIGGWFAFAKNAQIDLSFYQLEGTNEVINVLAEDGTRENRNAGKTLHQGVEYSIRYEPGKSWSLRLGGTNARHEYVEYVEQGKVYSGKSMEAAPGWMANAEVYYYPRFLPGARIGLEWQHIGVYFMDALNTEKYDGFDVMNLRMGYQLKGFEVWFNLLNLTDALYANSVAKSGYGKDYSPGDPRTFSLGLGYKFQKK